MKRSLRFNWVSRHQAVTVMLVIVAAAIFAVCVTRVTTGSQARYDSAVAARSSAENLLGSNQLAESNRRCREAVEILTELAAHSSDRRIRFEQAAALETLGMIQSAADQPDEADAHFRNSIDVWSRLLGADQTAAEVRWRLARCLTRWISLLIEAGRWEEAEQALERGSIVCRTRIANAPSDGRVDRQLLLIKNQLGLLFQLTGRSGSALLTFEEAVLAAKELSGRPSATAEDLELLITLLTNQARAHSAATHRDNALNLYSEARMLAERLSAASGSAAHYRDLVATLLESEAVVLERDPRKAQEARKLLEQAVAIRDSLVSGSSDELDYLDRLAQTCGTLAQSLLDARLYEKAEQYQRMELSYRVRLTQDRPDLERYQYGRGRAAHNLAELLRQRGKAAEALPLEREAAQILMVVYRENVLDSSHRRAISSAYWSLCTLLVDRKDYRSAAESIALYQSIEPDGFGEAHAAAVFLCRCILLCQQDRDLPAAEKERLVRAYTDRAIGALQTAVRYGFRDLNDLRTSRTYDPLRGRPDFSGIVIRLAEVEESVAEGPPR